MDCVGYKPIGSELTNTPTGLRLIAQGSTRSGVPWVIRGMKTSTLKGLRHRRSPIHGYVAIRCESLKPDDGTLSGYAGPVGMADPG